VTSRGALATLARFARPLLLLDSGLLLAGVLLTSLNMLLVGWSLYAAGHVLALVAFPAIASLHRERMDGWSWAALFVVEIGLILGLPQVASIWSAYAATPTGHEMLVPSLADPIGHFAELLLWVGVAFYGLAARGARALPAGVGWIFVAAAVVGLLGAFVAWWIISALWWVPAMLLLTLGLIAIGGSLSEAAQGALSDANAESPAQLELTRPS
jgi:hypothetical protein